MSYKLWEDFGDGWVALPSVRMKITCHYLLYLFFLWPNQFWANCINFHTNFVRPKVAEAGVVWSLAGKANACYDLCWFSDRVDFERSINYVTRDKSLTPSSLLISIFVPFDIKSKKRFFFVDLWIAGENWFGVGLDEFARCTSNLAKNRQTRMLSDLALIGCYNQTIMSQHDRNSIMLASAKRNLAAMSYFGLTEYQKV